MALITDPDDLSQGTETVVSDADFGAPSGEVVTVTSTANLPASSAGDFFEVRDMSVAAFNGLYQETGGSPTTSSITMTKISGSSIAAAGNPAAESCSFFGATGGLKNVMFDTEGLNIYLLEKGSLSTDGVTMLALHSFTKERWKDDAFLIAAAPFPIVGISFAAGQWQIGVDPSGNFNGWKWANNLASPTVIETRRLIRNAGWEEITSAGITQEKWFNVTTLGTFEDVLDKAYFRFGTDATDLAADIDFEFADVVNEPVKFYENFGNVDTLDFATSSTITRATGSFLTDGFQIGGQVTVQNADNAAHNGTYVLTNVVALTLTVTGTPFTGPDPDTNARLAVDNSNAFQCFLRVRDADPEGKTFDQSNLLGAGETEIIPKIIKFPLSNVTDLDITATDASITGGGPWDQIVIRYFDQAFNREVDSATNRDFGIVVDVGTHSGVDGSAPGAASVLTTAEGGLEDFGAGTYNSGTLRIHEGTDENTDFPIVSHTDTTITVTGTIAAATDISFTAQRSTPVSATKNQIYEKVQYLLRQSSDIDTTGAVVNGRTADAMMVFEGANLRVGKLLPNNPNGGGSGVIIEGFDANDTNNLFFFDNTGTQYNYPFVAAGTLVFNQGLVDDTDGEYWLFFEYTTRTTDSTIDCTGNSGDTYDLESDAGQMGAYNVNDYLYISGFAQSENNGLFIVTVVNTSQSDYTVRKVDGSDVGTAETNQTVSVDENPYPSPQAIIVDNNAGSDIAGAIGATSIGFDFDYDNNVQGGRTSSTPAAVVLLAGGKENSQMAVVSGLTITAAVGLTFSLTSAQERNYDNP